MHTQLTVQGSRRHLARKIFHGQRVRQRYTRTRTGAALTALREQG